MGGQGPLEGGSSACLVCGPVVGIMRIESREGREGAEVGDSYSLNDGSVFLPAVLPPAKGIGASDGAATALSENRISVL